MRAGVPCGRVDGTGTRRETDGTDTPPETQALRDLLRDGLQNLGRALRLLDASRRGSEGLHRFVEEALAATAANLSADPVRLALLVRQASNHRAEARLRCLAASRPGSPVLPTEPQSPRQEETVADMARRGRLLGLPARTERFGADVAGLQELLLRGLVGTASFAYEARALGQSAPEIDSFLARGLEALGAGQREVWELLALCLECGQANLRAVELLDQGRAAALGVPEPAEVRITPVLGKAILVSGNDIACLERLLRQTENTGIHVYTHGDMLSAHAYPALRRHHHLVGHFGGSWLDQQREFARFPGPILMTDGHLLAPSPKYRNRLFTSGLASWPGIRHVGRHDLLPLVHAVIDSPGFLESVVRQTVTVGYGHETLLGMLPQLTGAIRAGRLRHILVVGGDGAGLARSYCARLIEAVPRDCAMLAFGSAKYGLNSLDLGMVGDMPGFMDAGQCGDVHSIAQILLALAEAFDCGISELPVSFVLSGQGDRTAAVLLGLLELGVEGIRMDPGIPLFLTPAIRAVLGERFGVAAVTTPEDDLQDMLLHGADFAP